MTESTDTSPDRLQLPHTAHCLACGRDNPLGLKLDCFVDRRNGMVWAHFTPTADLCGFEGIVHGGLVSTIMDEVMTWAATWNIKRFCLCSELSVRFRQSVIAQQRVRVEAIVDFSRHKLVEPSAKIFDEHDKLLVTASGKYIPVTPEQHGQHLKSFVDTPATRAAAEMLGITISHKAQSE